METTELSQCKIMSFPFKQKGASTDHHSVVLYTLFKVRKEIYLLPLPLALNQLDTREKRNARKRACGG